ncbi:MAG: DUF6879 family protein [Micromonosporaceae bacterium]
MSGNQLLTDDEWLALFDDIRYTAFRLELQPAYNEPNEKDSLRRFLAGEQVVSDDIPGWATWVTIVRSLTERGGRMERVRVHEDPPTDYQRWERALGDANVEAGEVIWYLTREQAHQSGLLPDAGRVDWWLFDSHKLVQMHFDEEFTRVRNELVTDPAAVVRANVWRDLALCHARRLAREGQVEGAA